MSRNKHPHFLDVFSERSLIIYRLWMIIDKLQYNTRGRKVLTLDKLCIFDVIISDNNITNSVCRFFNPSIDSVINDNDDILINSSQLLRNVMKTGNVRERVIELYMLEMVDIEIIKGELYISLKNKLDIRIKNDLVDDWEMNLQKSKSLVAKSFNQLIESLIGVLYE
ncbi:hypothetical protein [Photobacterium damselae]|uniref:hypothetical protein n=1 Tax=Photobacterium damselae TaxID=38293 RepID=UPI00159424D4|nr:hypothetical protein [Photobacterium damselae]NVH48906.1 hypothetical protein [Photobacterium damselae subsp. damselae]